MRLRILSLLVGLLALSAPVQAQDRAVVVELFTSQGCSSCPPADRFFSEIAKRNDVIALAFHVDYWDYLGWKDKFSDAAYSARQRKYAAVNHHRVYTPQIAIQGRNFVVGHDKKRIFEKIESNKRRGGDVLLSAVRTSGRIEIKATPVGKSVGRTVVWMVSYTPRARVDIRRGENAGKSVVYTNIVNSWSEVARLNGSKSVSTKVDAAGSDPVVVIVQDNGGYGDILAAQLVR